MGDSINVSNIVAPIIKIQVETYGFKSLLLLLEWRFKSIVLIEINEGNLVK